MDEEVDPDNENVNSVLAQESSELLRIISGQTPAVIMKLCEMMPSEGRWDMVLGPGSSSATHHIEAMLNYYIRAKVADCCNFLQSVCILCENIPMHLESRLMSVAGNENSKYKKMQCACLLSHVVSKTHFSGQLTNEHDI